VDKQVTAKVRVNMVQKPGGAGPGSSTISFSPDYEDGRNKEWAVATPSLSLSMTVKDEVAEEHFASGDAFTLTFSKNDD
jgi:hypothetical protein